MGNSTFKSQNEQLTALGQKPIENAFLSGKQIGNGGTSGNSNPTTSGNIDADIQQVTSGADTFSTIWNWVTKSGQFAETGANDLSKNSPGTLSGDEKIPTQSGSTTKVIKQDVKFPEDMSTNGKRLHTPEKSSTPTVTKKSVTKPNSVPTTVPTKNVTPAYNETARKNALDYAASQQQEARTQTSLPKKSAINTNTDKRFQSGQYSYQYDVQTSNASKNNGGSKTITNTSSTTQSKVDNKSRTQAGASSTSGKTNVQTKSTSNGGTSNSGNGQMKITTGTSQIGNGAPTYVKIDNTGKVSGSRVNR